MNIKSLSGMLATVLVSAILSLSSARAADPSDVYETGRFQLQSGVTIVDGKDTPAILMVDTANGRVWILDHSNERGAFMKRLLLERANKAPEGMLTRPLPLIVKPAQ